jgi:chemotaxis protein methyltransferase CheR
VSSPPVAWRLPGYARVYALVQQRAGLLPPSCVPAAEEGIDRAMQRAGCTEFNAYADRLIEDPGAFDNLLTELTIGETYFFRTHEHFDFLRQHVLPELRRVRGPEHTVRVWSAGCASGEEPYSLAVLLREEGFERRMDVLATDISRAALARAREARYSPWSLRGEPSERMRPFLRWEDKRFVLAPEVRQLVRFQYLNLALDTWPSPDTGIHALDIIFCRNVLIYFTRETIAAVARRLYESLAEGGFLITGPSDPPLNGLAPLEPVLQPWGIAWHRPAAGSPRALPPAPPVFTPPPALPSPPPVAPAFAPPAPPPPPQPPPPAEEQSPGTAVREIRALANLQPERAVAACAETVARHPFSAELRYLEALLLLGLGRLGEAERAVRQALYLEPSLAVAHFTLGHVLRRLGDTEGALRAFRTTERLCGAMSPEAPVPLAEGANAASLAAGARAERERLGLTDAREES